MSNENLRRDLKFAALDDAIADVQALHAKGYRPVGQWDLAQACAHLNDWMRFPMEGYPKPSLPLRLGFALVRPMMGKRLLRWVLEEGKMQKGSPTMPATVYPPDGDEAAAVEQFCATARRLQTHEGPWHPSPVFGEMDSQTHVKLQLIHCEHHLSFLVPV